MVRWDVRARKGPRGIPGSPASRSPKERVIIYSFGGEVGERSRFVGEN